MYIAYNPPQMLPTQTLNPTSATGGAKSTHTAKAKRDLESGEEIKMSLNQDVLFQKKRSRNSDFLWWCGAGITALGGVGYLCF